MTDGAAATRTTDRATTGPVRHGGQGGHTPRRSGHRATAGFFPVIRRWVVVIAAATGIALVVGYGLAQRATPTYEARADLLVGPLDADLATVRAATAATGTYAQLAVAPATIEVVARETGIDRDLLYAGVRVSADPEARILRVRARAHTPAAAAAAANGVAEHLVGLAAEDSAAAAGRLRVVDGATPPSSPISPRIEVIAPLAAVGGLLGGLALVMVLELVGDPAGSVTEVRRAARAPTLSVGGDGGEVIATHLALVRPGTGSVLLTGTAGTDEGGPLAQELAAAWAATGDRVVVVDAGAGEAGDEPPDRVVGDLVAGGARVVVHAPPVATTPATLAWARAVDTTVLVARRDTGRRGPLAETADALRRVGADLALTVLHPGGRRPLAVVAPRVRVVRPAEAVA